MIIHITKRVINNLAEKNIIYEVVGEVRPSEYTYSVRARPLKKHFLIEDSYGRSELRAYSPVGIESKLKDADERAYKIAKDKAE
ncbi:MAG: hypothetical protein AABX16_04190 [Nanoarchaeota archaeon]